MKNIIFLSVAFLLVSCNSTSEQGYIAQSITSEKASVVEVQIDPGKELMEKYCHACHSPSASMEDRLAPPMIAVKKHYLNNDMSREEFSAAIWDWIEEPSEEKSKMRGARRRFGIMPYQPYTKEDIMQIANYMYDNEIDQPEWFDEHFKNMRGKN